MLLKKFLAIPLVVVSMMGIANVQENAVTNPFKHQDLSLNLPDLGGPVAPPASTAVTPAMPDTLALDPLMSAPQWFQGPEIAPRQGFSIPFQLDDHWGTSLNSSSGAAQYHSNTTLFDARASLGYQSAAGSGVLLDGATMIGAYSAFGVNLNISSRYADVVFSGITALPETPWRIASSLSYAQGHQDVKFYSGSEALKVSQMAGIVTGQYVNPAKDPLGWQTLDLSVWGARAHNRNAALSPTFAVVERPEGWDIITDRRLVSEGRMRGFAVGNQYALTNDLVVNGALGYERVVYPFSDGSAEHNNTPYIDAEVRYQATPQLMLASGVKRDATQFRWDIGAEYGLLGLKAFTAKGLNGLLDDYGVMLTLNIGRFGQWDKPASASDVRLAERLSPHYDGGAASLLASAIKRPTQLPQTFLIKADPTAVTEIAIAKAGLPDGSKVNPTTGDITFQVGTGPIVINGVTRNTTPFHNRGYLSVAGNTVTIHATKMPVPIATDVYRVSLTDATGAIYAATVTGVRGSGDAAVNANNTKTPKFG